MSRMDQPTADDVILDLLVDGVKPTHENLVSVIATYPQHRDALIEFFANLAVQSALKGETTASGCSVEKFANFGVSRVLSHRHELSGKALKEGEHHEDGEHKVESQPRRLSQLIRESGIAEDRLAGQVGLDTGLMMKLDLRRIVGPLPTVMVSRIADELHIPPAHIIASVAGQPIPSSRGNLRKARGKITIKTETFEEAINTSTLSDELKAFWLQRLADENGPMT